MTVVVEVFPHELRPGDVYRDSGCVEWTVRTQPRTYLNGHRVEAKVSPAGAPTAMINLGTGQRTRTSR